MDLKESTTALKWGGRMSPGMEEEGPVEGAHMLDPTGPGQKSPSEPSSVPPAFYECWRCEHRFWGDAGPGTICMECGHNYLTWLNHPLNLKRRV